MDVRRCSFLVRAGWFAARFDKSKLFSIFLTILRWMMFHARLINPPGSTSNYFLQFSKNKFIIPNPVMAIFQGGVIKVFEKLPISKRVLLNV
jgi:hypothetical protein